MHGRHGCAAAVLVALVATAEPAPAADFSVQSDTIGQAYRIRGRDGLFTVPRSRVTQLLSLYGTDLLGKAGDPGSYKELSIVLNFSLDHDFGVNPSSLDPHDEASFVPHLDRTQVGLLSGHVSGRFGLDPGFSFSLGRVFLLDPAGFAALDGLKVGLRMARVLSLELAAGLELAPDVRLSIADFSPEGVAWGDRDGFPTGVHPEVITPRPRPLLAASLGIGIPGAGSLTISFRSTWQDPLFRHVSLQRLGLGLDVSGPELPVSVRIRSAFDLLWRRFSEIDAEVEVLPNEKVGFGIRFLHLLPLFDSASIFNVFHVDPHDEVGAFVTLGKPHASRLTIAAGAFLRLTDVSDIDPSGADRLSDAGGWLVIRARLSPVEIAWSARGSGGESGVLAGTRLRASLVLLDGRLIPSAGLGLWFWDDPLRREHFGLTTGGSAILRWRVVRPVLLVAGMDVFNNRVSGTGLAGSVRLVVEF
jgi:hypothetical protein